MDPARKYEPISTCRLATIVAPSAEQNTLVVSYLHSSAPQL